MIKQNRKNENSATPLLKVASSPKWVSFWKNKKNILVLSGILIMCFMVYLPSLQNGFVNWDDGPNIYENPYITAISGWDSFFKSVKGIFSTDVMGNYNPLPILTFAFEKMFYGFDRLGWWHLDNIILHLFCTLLVFRIALALGLKIIPAAFCALFFGIHPMRVESVAWLTERKDLLYGSFYLLALYYYIKSVKLSFQKRYLLIIHLSFILSLLSKIQAVVLPLSMLLVDYYFDRKPSMKLVYEKWSYFLLSLVNGLWGIYLLRYIGHSIKAQDYFSLSERILIGSYSYIVYIIKSIAPYEMIPVHPSPVSFGGIFYASILSVLTILGLLYYFFRKQMKVLVFGLLFFTFNIMFLLQILSAGVGFIADRFTYIAYFGLFFIYATGLQWLLEKYKKNSTLIYLATLIILGVFGYMNFEQNKIWKNGETLWSHEIKYYDQMPFAWKKRADYYSKEARYKEAIHDYSKVIQYSPDSKKNSILVDRGITYAKLNMYNRALQDFIAAESLGSTSDMMYYYRSHIYSSFKKYDKAKSDIEKYLRSNPDDLYMKSNLRMMTNMLDQYRNIE